MTGKKNNDPEVQEKTDVQDTQDNPEKVEASVEDFAFSLYEKRSYDALVAIFQELRELRRELVKDK